MSLLALAAVVAIVVPAFLAITAARARQEARRLDRRRPYDRVATENPIFSRAINTCVGRSPVDPPTIHGGINSDAHSN